MPGGDGDQAFFARLGIQRLTEPDGLRARSEVGEGPAGGEFPGEHAALATKAVTGIADQISRRGSAGVVVHSTKNPSVSFDGSSIDADAVGNGRLRARMN
jgi:hypothetical protein